jgi:hydrogenase maturation HypF-like protein
LDASVRPEDIVMGFGPPEGDAAVWAALQDANTQEAMTFALPGPEGSYAFDPPTEDVFMHQEMIEMLYHTLWETVHVFFEHRERGYVVGQSEFLYPFLGREKQATDDLIADVANSIQMKVHDDAKLRSQLAHEQAEQISAAFQRGISHGIRDSALAKCEAHSVDTIVLSGGVIQNELLLEDFREATAKAPLRIWTNHAVPPNDGGIGLGQAALAAFGQFDPTI